MAVTTITWAIATVDVAGYSTWPSLAFSPSGQAAIAYFSSLNHALRFATLNPDGTWAIETVDTVFGDCAPSLVYRFSQPAISYASTTYPTGDTSNPLRAMNYALRRGGVPPWTITTFAPGGYGSSLAFDASRLAGISFFDKDRALGYVHSADSSWSSWVGSTVDGLGNGYFNSLAFGPSGQPAIAYSSTGSGGANDSIKYAVFDGSHWSSKTVGDGDGWCTLAFTASGDPAISYVLSRSVSESSVIYGVFNGASWVREAIAAGADSPSLALTPDGGPAISYHDRAAMAVKYAVVIDRVWQHFLVDQAGKDQNGVFSGDFTLTSLAFSPSGQPAISYYDRNNGAIKFAVGTVSVS